MEYAGGVDVGGTHTKIGLVDRGGRELPIQPDFVGLTLSDVPADYRVNVRLSEIDGTDEIVVEPAGGP